MNKLLSTAVVLIFALQVHAVEMGVPIQLKFAKPDGSYPTDSNASFVVQILSPTGGCVVYEEDFNAQNVVSGSISLALGSGSPGTLNPAPAPTIRSAYDNSTTKNNLTCVDSNNNTLSSGQSYNPGANDTRVLRVRATIDATPLVADFIQRAAPYAVHAESVGGKVGADILVQNSGTSLNQSNLENIFANATKFNKLQNLANNGVVDNAMTATSAGTSNYFTAALTGDVRGTQSATVVAAIRGVGVAATAPVSGQVLGYNGTNYVPMTVTASAPVASVNGQQGAVVLNASHIAGVVTSASPLLGDVTGNVSATVVSTVGGKNAASITATVNDVYAATSLPTMNTLAKRDGSGGLTAATFYAGDLRVNQGVKLYNITNTNRVSITAPGAFADYDLVLPANNGNPGEVLQTDGSGTLTWAAGTSVTSSSIVTALGFTPADSSLVVIKSNNLSDLTSATVARTNLGLGGAATLNVGTTAGTVAAGDDSRITDALTQTAFNASVAPATCTSAQTMYWNSVSSQFLCTNILISGDVAGTASAVTVTRVQGVGVSFASIATNHILQYNGTNLVNRAIPTCMAGEYLTFNGTVWSCATDAGGGGAVTSISVTSPISSTGGSTPTLSIAQANGSTNGYLSSADWTTFNSKITSSVASLVAVLGYTPANSATVSALSTTVSNKVTSSAVSVAEVLGYVPASATSMSTFMVKSNNLSDLASSASARINLGLGGFATVSSLDLGSASATGTIAAARLGAFSGDVTSTSGSAVLTIANSGVTSGTYTKFQVNSKGIITSGTNLTSADVTAALGFTPANNSASGTYAQRSNNLSDLASATVARTNLGLGGAAVLSVGTSAGTVAAGDDSRITNALSQTAFNASVAPATCTSAQTMYWNSVSSQFACINILVSGDVTGTASNVTVTKVQGVGVSITALAANHMLQYNGTNFVNRAIPTCSANQYLSFNGTVWSCANDAGATGVVTNVSSTNSYITVATSSTTPALTLNVGTSAGTVAAGNDTRIANAVQTTTLFNGDVSGTYNAITLNATGVAAATYAKVTVNTKGLITSGTPLVASDIPVLDAGKITTGQLPVTLGGTGAATSATALSNIGAARRGANDDITSFINNLIFSAAGTGLTVSNNAAVNGNLSVSGTTSLIGNVTLSASASVAGNIAVTGDANITGVVNGTSKNAVFQTAPTTAGTTTAYTVSYGSAADAKITSNSAGDSVRFRVNATNTGAATLKVANAPAANLFSRFTGAAVGSGDLQAGFYQAHFDGTNWVVDIPPRRIALTGLNITADAVQSVAAAGVRPGDSVGCSLTLAAGTLNGANNWTTAVVPVTDSITVVLFETGASGNVTAITCNVQK